MSFLWIICTSADGAIERLEVLKSKHKSKVGKYIRNNIDQFLFMFYKVWTCTVQGKIGEDLSKYIEKNNFQYSDTKNKKCFENIVSEILENYSDEDIVDELNGEDRNDGSYANIICISAKNIIQL